MIEFTGLFYKALFGEKKTVCEAFYQAFTFLRNNQQHEDEVYKLLLIKTKDKPYPLDNYEAKMEFYSSS